MLTLPPTVRIFVHLAPADMRRSLDGLAALTREVLQEVWIAAFASFGSFNPTKPDALDRWLTGITNHKLLDALKAAGRLKRGGNVPHVPAAGDRTTALSDLFSRVASPRRTPSREYGAREAVHAIQIALIHGRYRQRSTGHRCDQLQRPAIHAHARRRCVRRPTNEFIYEQSGRECRDM